jgi:hypothetical protein
MKNHKPMNVWTLWERKAKAHKVASTATPQLQPVTIESEAQNPDVQAVTIESHVHIQNQSITVDIAREVTEADIASNDLVIASTTMTEHHGHGEPSAWSPIRDGDDSEYESSDEAIYDVDFLSHDPGKRVPVKNYDANERNTVIRAFIAMGPCQPHSHNFPIREIGVKPQRFVDTWFHDFEWLEYSVERDAAFYFICYLFKHKVNSSGGDAFVNVRFRNWHMRSRIEKHVGGMSSFHNVAQDKYNHFIRPKAQVTENFVSTNERDKALRDLEYDSRKL